MLTPLSPQANSASGLAMLSTLGIDPQSVTGQLGLNCSPITVIGVGADSTCSQQPVCCQNNNYVSMCPCLCVGA